MRNKKISTHSHDISPVAHKVLKKEMKPSHGKINSNKRILFVDDEETLATIAKQMLERLGYDVTVKTDSVEALELFRKQPDWFDLVITDHEMPRLTGEILTKELLLIRNDIPVILSTGNSYLIPDKTTTDRGIKGVLIKPYGRLEIANVIQEVIGSVKENDHAECFDY